MKRGVKTGAWRITTRAGDTGSSHSTERVLYLGGNAEAAMELYRDTVNPTASIIGVELAEDVVIRAALDTAPLGADNFELASAIVEDLLRDLQGRRGLRQEWDQIDPATQDEIRSEWFRLVEERLR